MAEKLNITEPLSDYIVSEQAGQLPPAIKERAKIHILDTIGAMVSGSQLKPGKVGIDFVRTQGGPQDATIVATDLRTSPILAALANAMTAHADETDDAHFPTVTHPGSVILPSALAVAETQHRSGADLIAAVVLGYDVMCRINKAFDRGVDGEAGASRRLSVRRFWRSSGGQPPVERERATSAPRVGARRDAGVRSEYLAPRSRAHRQSALFFRGAGAQWGHRGSDGAGRFYGHRDGF